ncbi:MAG: VCBS repeat-containing protein [Pseudomonadota bacterium]
MRRPLVLPVLLMVGAFAAASATVGCGGGASTSASGGRSGAGGGAPTGGAAGSSSGTGGSLGSGGGLAATGGAATGGAATGGAATGGAATGGAATGGGAGFGTGGRAMSMSGGLGGGITGAGTGGAAGGGGAGPGGGGNGGAAGAPAPATCSQMPVRTAPIAGKESFRYDPVDTRFPFGGHWMGVFSPDPRYIGDVALADFDKDGDLDFASGQRQDVGGGMIWWEYCAPDHWVPHNVGTGHTSWAGGSAADFDGDGWIDLIAGNSWYRNPGTPRTSLWTRYATGGPNPEEIIIGDVTGDSKPDALYVHRNFVPQYWSPGPTATATWVKGPNLANPQQQGGAIGDMDGDGDNDILVGYRWWYRNMNGDGSQWQTVTIFPSGFDDSPLTALGDLDGDGDTDFVMGTHFGARVAWAENVDKLGTQFTLHMLSTNKNYIHTIWAADFDNDGDLDLLVGQNVGPSFIFENTDGKGTFLEHRIAADTRGHEARVGDVDCDGDLDIAGTPWGDPNEGGEEAMPPRDHIYLQNMLVERGGTPLFTRKPYEVFQASLARVCRR